MANEDQLHLMGCAFLDDNGDPISGAKLNTYETGTSTPQATYTDDALTVAHANPILTDSAGRWPVPIYMQRKQYKLVITDENDVVKQTIDPYTPFTFGIEAIATDKRVLAVDNQGLLTDAQEIFEFLIPAGITLTLPANATDSRCDADVAATAQNTVTIYQNAVSIGTIVISAAGTTGAFTVSSGITFNTGDRLRLVNQATADATLADVRFSLVLTAS